MFSGNQELSKQRRVQRKRVVVRNEPGTDRGAHALVVMSVGGALILILVVFVSGKRGLVLGGLIALVVVVTAGAIFRRGAIVEKSKEVEIVVIGQKILFTVVAGTRHFVGTREGIGQHQAEHNSEDEESMSDKPHTFTILLVSCSDKGFPGEPEGSCRCRGHRFRGCPVKFSGSGAAQGPDEGEVIAEESVANGESLSFTFEASAFRFEEFHL